MKEKVSSFFKWGTGAFTLVMANNLVISAFMLITGLSNLLFPERAQFWDALTLSLLLFAYAAISIIVILTHNEKAAGGKELAGNMIKDFLNERKDRATTKKDLFKNDEAAQNFSKQSHERLASLTETVAEKHKKLQSASKGVMLTIYVLILALSIVLIIRNDIAIMLYYFIIGAVLIINGVMSIISATTARKERRYKFYFLSLLLSVCSIIMGVFCVIMAKESGLLTTQAVSILLIVKSVGDFVVAFRNKEVKSSINDTITQIKQQKKDIEAGSETPKEGEETQSTPEESKEAQSDVQSTPKKSEEPQSDVQDTAEESEEPKSTPEESAEVQIK